MNDKQFVDEREQFVRRYEYEDEWVVAVDLGVGDDEVDVDVVGTTAIVVSDGARPTETEFELPASAANVDVQNGVLTVRGEQ